MMCNVKSSVCNPSMQGEMAACAMKEAKMHTIDMAKLMSMAGHLGKLCNLLAEGSHRECRAILEYTLEGHEWGGIDAFGRNFFRVIRSDQILQILPFSLIHS
ncbi:unnamed protein product, partial [Medioppia subpectinata]